MCVGVSKSGSPAPRPMMSLPSALSCATRPVSATVGEGLTRWTRFETGRLTGHRRDAISTTRELFLMTDSTATGFAITADYTPAGDQPQAIAELVDGLRSGLTHQTLLGVTGSGKTFSVARVINEVQRPT